MNEKYRQYLLEGERVGLRYGLNLPRNVQLGNFGNSLGNFLGSSLEFMEHREYIPGDDLRNVDWNAYARSDKLTVKLYRNEVNPHVDIIIDCSRSMALDTSEKTRATLGLGAVFAQAAVNCSYSFSSWKLGQQCHKVANGDDRPANWQDINFDFAGDVVGNLPLAASMWKSRGIRVLLSDLFWPSDPYKILMALSQRASQVIIVQVLASEDAEPAQSGNVRIIDSETEDLLNIFIDERTLKLYQKNLADHQQNWHRACKQAGAIFTTLIAEDTVKDWNLNELITSSVLKPL